MEELSCKFDVLAKLCADELAELDQLGCKFE